MIPPCLLLISGLPCSGKTSLGQWLAQQLHLPFLHKDGIKEVLFDTLGWKDRRWSKQLSQASNAILTHLAGKLLAAGVSVIVESNFPPAALLTLQEAAMAQRASVIHIRCTADPEVLLQRFEQRVENAERHPGHVDAQYLREFASLLESASGEDPIVGEIPIEVDTTSEESFDRQALLAALQAILHPGDAASATKS